MITSLASPILCLVLENSFCRISLCRLSSANRAFFARISSFLAWTDDIVIPLSRLQSCEINQCGDTSTRGQSRNAHCILTCRKFGPIGTTPCLRSLPQKITLGELAELPTTPIESTTTPHNSTPLLPLDTSAESATPPHPLHRLNNPPNVRPGRKRKSQQCSNAAMPSNIHKLSPTPPRSHCTTIIRAY